jgi:hypothetical protein
LSELHGINDRAVNAALIAAAGVGTPHPRERTAGMWQGFPQWRVVPSLSWEAVWGGRWDEALGRHFSVLRRPPFVRYLAFPCPAKHVTMVILGA